MVALLSAIGGVIAGVVAAFLKGCELHGGARRPTRPQR